MAEHLLSLSADLADHNPHPILRVSQEGVLLYSNPAGSPLLRMWNGQVGQSLSEFWRSVMVETFCSGKPKEVDVFCEERIFSLTLAPLEREGWVNIYGVDITERKQYEGRLNQTSLYDPLTGLPNRSLFLEHLNQAFQGAKAHPHSNYAVFSIDIDQFKSIDDSLGSATGNQLLKAVARRLEFCLRPEDRVARMEGDQFALLLKDVPDPQDAIKVAKRLREIMEQPFYMNDQKVFLSLSVGIALFDVGYPQAEEMLRDADTAMHQAKAKGRAQYILFQQAMHEHTVNRWQWETSLHLALERHELQNYYQPLISLKTGQVLGFEALVRWNHPQRGLVLPGDFIPLAEETRLILPLGEWVLRESCRQLRLWQEHFPSLFSSLSVSVNFSSTQFLQRDLVSQIDHILNETQIAPSCLKIELTESVFMKDIALATSLLLALKEMGVALYIDDFGTGYSSLNHLRRFPINVLKIDRSFVANMLENREDLEIVRTIIMLSHHLHKKVVAEGIERPDQLAYLQALDCDQGQGYYFSKPLEAQAIPTLLNQPLSWLVELGESPPALGVTLP